MRAILDCAHLRSAVAMLFGVVALSACGGEKVAGPTPAIGPTLSEVAAVVGGPTLSGEALTGSGKFGETGNCATDGFVTLNFTASGVAAGPYVGTFGETGRIVLSFATDPKTGERLGTVVKFDANFNISSPPDQVSGNKSGFSGVGVADCDERGGGVVTSIKFSSTSQYSATISTASGKFPDQGQTQVDINGTPSNIVLVETFGTVAQGTLVLNPPTALNTVDTKHCVTATVTDAFGKPVLGVTVFFTVTGAVNTGGKVVTDKNGNATFCYSGPPLPGADAITAFADLNKDGNQGPDEPSGAATKTWVLPATTPLCEIKITNGGWITALNGDKSTFGGNAKSSSTGATQGQEQYQDHGPAQPMNVHSINVLAIVCDGSGQEASIYGDATIDGSGSYPYRIKVRDLGEPGVGSDTYWLILGNGYTSGDQILQGGNVQIHRQ